MTMYLATFPIATKTPYWLLSGSSNGGSCIFITDPFLAMPNEMVLLLKQLSTVTVACLPSYFRSLPGQEVVYHVSQTWGEQTPSDLESSLQAPLLVA